MEKFFLINDSRISNIYNRFSTIYYVSSGACI
jgi:hypothetical protein